MNAPDAYFLSAKRAKIDRDFAAWWEDKREYFFVAVLAGTAVAFVMLP